MRRSCGANCNERVDDSVNGLPTSWYGFIDNRIGPTLVYENNNNNLLDLLELQLCVSEWWWTECEYLLCECVVRVV